MVVSGLAWMAAAVTFLAAGPKPAFVTLFVCGLAIAPVAQVKERYLFKPPAAGPGKKLEWIAIATVPVLLAGFWFGYLWLPRQPYAAIPLVAIGVGLRYLVFPVMYGGRVFLALGAAFVAGGAAGLAAPERLPLPMTFALALIELQVGPWLVRQWRSAGPGAR